MRKIFITTIHKKLLLSIFLCFIIFTAFAFMISPLLLNKHSQVFNATRPEEIEEENALLRNLLSSLVPNKQETILEDEYRNIYMNVQATPPPTLPTVPISKVIVKGVETEFKILYNDPEYLRPVYDPGWKGAYYRSWLYLPYKNIEARHKIFAFSIGGSMNYDIFGSLGFNPKTGPNAPIDNHRNINFLIYDFQVKSVKVFQNQVILLGEPKQTGAQIVSIVQNDLLPGGTDSKDFVFQLSTPKGYEVDFLYYNIIRYEYLMKIIEEHTVRPSFSNTEEAKSIDKLLRENTALKQELSFFIPDTDEVVPQQVNIDCLNNKEENSSINSIVQNGRKVPFSINYSNPHYKRPLYDPLWKTNYKRGWCFIPGQIEFNMHRLHIIPGSKESRYDFFGALGFNEKYQAIKPGQYGFLIYNFHVSKAIIRENQLLLLGTPSRTGAQILTINHKDMNGYENYLTILATPDNSIFDCSPLSAY